MSIQVFPTAPSPTVTHLMNFEALILKNQQLCTVALPATELVYVLESIKVKGNTRSFKEKKLHKRRRMKRERE